MIGMGICVGEAVDLSNVEYDSTLGSAVLSVGVTLGTVVGNFDGVSTLGDGVSRFGSVSALLSVSTLFCRALRVGSLASKLGVVIEGSAIRMDDDNFCSCLL